jgi:hypothetical protein
MRQDNRLGLTLLRFVLDRQHQVCDIVPKRLATIAVHGHADEDPTGGAGFDGIDIVACRAIIRDADSGKTRGYETYPCTESRRP